jgi:hypothetical protein
MPDLSLNLAGAEGYGAREWRLQPAKRPINAVGGTRLPAYLGLNYGDDSAVNQPIDEAFRTQVRIDIRSPRNASGAGRLSA